MIDATAATRGLSESTAYWSAYIMGAYEGPENVDGDGENFYRWGFNFDAEPEYAFIYQEVFRDSHNDGAFPNWAGGVYTQAHHEQQSVVHEIGHQFELWVGHPGGNPPAGYSIMSRPQHNPIAVIPPNIFAEDEIKIIRQAEYP